VKATKTKNKTIPFSNKDFLLLKRFENLRLKMVTGFIAITICCGRF
jgi:hypothetical protein